MSMQPTKTPLPKLLLQVGIFAIIITLAWLMPPISVITTAGMRLLGIFIAFVYGISVTREVWPCILSLLLFPLTGMTDFAGVITATFGTDTFLFVMLSFALVGYMEVSGATSFAATWLMKRKFLKGHPWRLIFMLMFICWIVSCFVNAIAAMLLTWSFIYEIFNQFEYKPYEKLPTLVLLGTCIVAGLGLSAFPWGSNAIVILSAFANTSGTPVDYLTYLGFSLPFCIGTMVIYLLLCKFIFRVDVEALKNFDPNSLSAESQQMTREKAIAMCAMLAMVLMILLPSFFPPTSALGMISAKFGLSGKLFLIFVVVQLIRLPDGRPACDFPEIARKGIHWNILFIAAVILFLSSYLGNESTGISAFFAQTIAPLFQGKAALLFLIVASLVTVIATNFMVNVIVAVLMISITTPMIQAFGWDPVQYACLYSVLATVAFLLPSASQSSLILFSNSAWIRAVDVFKYGIPTIIAMTVMSILWNILYFSII